MLSKFIETFATTIDLHTFVAHMLMASVLGFAAAAILSGQPVTKEQSSILRVMVAICLSMTLMVSILASSHALAIGMVGALSVVRFRWVSHDPHALFCLFLAMVLGMAAGFGAWLPGLILLGVTWLVLKWILPLKAKEMSYLSVGGDPEHIAMAIREAKSLYPQLRVSNLDSNPQFASWSCQIPGLDAVQRLNLFHFLQTKLPQAQIRLWHEK